MYFKTPPFAQTPAVVSLFQTSKDRRQDWQWRDAMDFVTELVPDTQIVVLRCPTKRLMNTKDYDDAKFEIGLFYRLKGFYTIVGPDPEEGQDRNMIFGNGDEMIIEILDLSLSGTGILPLLILVVSFLMLI